MFHVELSWDGGSVRAEGRTIKAAETVAARLALEQIAGSGQLEGDAQSSGVES